MFLSVAFAVLAVLYQVSAQNLQQCQQLSGQYLSNPYNGCNGCNGCGGGSIGQAVTTTQINTANCQQPFQYGGQAQILSPQFVSGGSIGSSCSGNIQYEIPSTIQYEIPANIQYEIPTISQYDNCNCRPAYATTIVDNSVSNALANALQLLIVSDLIDSTINCRNGDVNQCITPICETPYVDVVSEYVTQPYNQVVDVYGSGCCSTPIETYSGPVVEYYTQEVSPIQLTQQVSPCAAEVVFPSAIPAQLTCNFGYVPSTVPVVSVNVEPLNGIGAGSCGCNSCGCKGGSYFF